jgi:cytochrome P450
MSIDELPVVPGGNVLGHVHLFQDSRLRFLRTVGETGPLSRLRFLHRWVVMASSPETSHAVLVEHAKSFEKSPGIRVLLHELAGDGLFTSEGELWKKQRRLMAPLFHAQPLAGYAPTMSEVARRALAEVADGERIDLSRLTTRIAMGVVAATLFGAESARDADDIGHALTVALKWVDDQMASTYLTVQITLIELLEKLQPVVPAPLASVQAKIEEALRDPILLPGRRDPELVAAVQRLDGYIQALIDDRRASADRRQARVDLLTKLLLVRDLEGGRTEGMSDKQVRDEANTLFVAGHETTANALAWSFSLLGQHPEALARAQAEADAFGPEGPTTYEPERLAYTTRVFREALRLYPPVVLLPRRSLEPVEIAGVTLPERTIVFVNPYGLHMSPDVWPDPERFDPDRFLPEREALRHKSAWLPFGVGPRVCIGNHFAMMEGPLVLATLLRRARFELPSRPIEADAFATLRPKGGVPAVVHHRET